MKATNYWAVFMMAVFVTLISCKTEVKQEEPQAEPKVAEVIEKTLYEKLGGAEGISAIVDDIVAEHLKNENVSQFFQPLADNPEHMATFKEHVRNFFGAGTGGSETYAGRDMPGAHKGLNISEAEFMHATDDILLVLDRHKIEKDARNEVLAILFSMKWAVVRQ